MCNAARPGGAIIANVSISGPRSRSGASCLEPLASSPSQAASTTTNERPRKGSGICSNGGRFIRRPSELISSGTLAVHPCQLSSTSAARSCGQNRTPA